MNGRKFLVGLNRLGFELEKNNYAFFICGFFFIFGSIAGVIFSYSVDDGDTVISILNNYLAGFSKLEFSSAKFLSLFFELSGSVILTLLFGFSILGVVFIPCISLMRGFSLSFTLSLLSVANFNAHFAIFLVILRAFASVPLLFFVSAHAFDASRKLLVISFGRDTGYRQLPLYDKKYFFRIVFAILLLFIFSVIEKFLILRLYNLFY